MGLLSRASNLDEIEIKQGLAFSDFINKHSLKSCAVLEQNNSFYYVKHSIGFDALSIISSVSTIDFWEGICKESQTVYSFTEKTLSPLLQLFSENLKYNLHELYFYKNAASQILIGTTNFSKETVEDFEILNDEYHSSDIQQLNSQISDDSVCLKFQIDFSEAVESFLDSEVKDNSFDISLLHKAIIDELYNRFTCFYNTLDATVRSGENSLKTIFITGKAYSSGLITNHLILNLSEVLGKHAELIQIEFLETADSCEQVQNFLQAE